jgi:hypothetical protein
MEHIRGHVRHRYNVYWVCKGTELCFLAFDALYAQVRLYWSYVEYSYIVGDMVSVFGSNGSWVRAPVRTMPLLLVSSPLSIKQ